MAEAVNRHLQALRNQQKQSYLQKARDSFEASLAPVIAQLTALICNDIAFDTRAKALEILLKRVRRSYLELLDELGAEEREKEALAAGEAWRKNLTKQVLDTYKAMGYNL